MLEKNNHLDNEIYQSVNLDSMKYIPFHAKKNISHTETVKIVRQVAENLGIQAKIQIGVNKYSERNRKHNQQQNIEQISYVFSSATKQERFEKLLLSFHITPLCQEDKTITLRISDLRLLAINSQIKVLQKESNSFFSFNKKRKQEKIKALKEIRDNAMDHETIKNVRKSYSNIEKGFFSSRTKTLLNYLENENTLNYKY